MAEALIRPTAISLDCHSECRDFRHYAAVVMESLRAVGLPAVLRWMDDKERSGTGEEIAAALANLPDAPGPGAEGASLHFELDDGARGGMLASARYYPDQGGTTFSSLNLRRVTRMADDDGAFIAFQDRCSALARELLTRVGLYSATLRTEGAGMRCLPEVPLVEDASRLAATNRAEVDASYESPDAFWKAGWTQVAEREGQILLARALDVATGTSPLMRIIDDQWAMARAAKPGLTDYKRPEVHPAEKPVFEAGAARLEAVGYSADEQLLEYSCVLERDEHLRGWEIFALANIVKQGAASDGRVVKTVRIVFLDEWAARQERRPLLDVGCRVFFTAEDGSLTELTD